MDRVRGASSERGFTLIELVVVITILGILAAFAVPRFAALEVQARSAATQALAGSIRSAATLAYSLWLAGGQVSPIIVEGETIVIANGYPNLATIDNTLSEYAGFTYDEATGVFQNDDVTGNCRVTYAEPAAPGTAPGVTLGVDGC